MARLTFTRQLPKHDNAIDSVAINECSGDLATADGSILRLWDINGNSLAVVDTAKGCSVQSTVLCVAFSHANDWDTENVVITGGSDGVVRFWGCVFTQVKEKSDKVVSESDEDEDDEDEVQDLKKTHDPDKDTDSLENLHLVEGVVTRNVRGRINANRNSGSFLAAGGSGSGQPQAGSSAMNALRRESLRGSRSEGNLQDQRDGDDSSGGGSFELLSEREIDTSFALANGFVWKRELVFRGKLTLHTSYSRKDNLEPASITAIGIAR